MHDFNGIIESLHNILNGIDPATGEVFDRREMYDNPALFAALKDLYFISMGRKKPESKNLLNRPSQAIFEELKAWRLEKAQELGVPAYIVFTDKELWSIAEGDVCKKEDLLLVSGIKAVKYEAYANELFDILKDYF